MQDPYAFEDMVRSKLTLHDDKSRDMTKSAKTVMKRPIGGPFMGRVVDLTADPKGFGIRPSTAIQIQQIEGARLFNKSLPKNKLS